MRASVLVLLAACGESTPAPVQVPEAVPLPTDAELGELAIMGATDPGTWAPISAFPFLVDDTPHTGDGPSPSWRATDTRGAQLIVTSGETMQVPYGCEGNELTVSKLRGEAAPGELRCPELATNALASGVVWLSPLGSPWSARAVPIANAKSVHPARRDLRVGRFAIEIVRTDPMRGAVSVLHDAKLVHQMTFERAAIGDAIDLLAGGIGVPVPEAAWSLDQERMLLVFKVEEAEGLGFKTIVVGPDGGRTVRSMSTYLFHCASPCS